MAFAENRHNAPPTSLSVLATPSGALAAQLEGVIFMDAAIAGRPCCPDARCRCSCGCRRHSHYRRCQPCALLGEHARPANVIPLTVRSALAFEEWPPTPRANRLAHLFPAGPRPVEG